MVDLTFPLILLLSIIPTIFSILMSCYSNATLDLPSSAILHNNFTLQSCQCLMIDQTITVFQYSSISQSCYTFGSASSPSDLRVNIGSQVCFVDRTSIPYPTTATVGTTLSPPPITTSISVSGNNYYTQEVISLSNNSPLTSLLIVVTVPITFGVTQPTQYTTFWSGTMNCVINQTSDSVMYIYQLIPGQTIVTGQWNIGAQFNSNGQVRSTNNDTYVIQIPSYQDIVGYF